MNLQYFKNANCQFLTLTKSSHSQKSKHAFALALISVLTGFAVAAPPVPPVNQLPTGPKVGSGSVSITQTQANAAASMVVNQTSPKAIINWDTFNLGSKAAVTFNQPNPSSALLNRILDNNPSQILGQIKSNGQIFFTNPNGIYFGPSSSVSVGSLLATTNSISDKDFLSGNYKFTGNGSSQSISNEGQLSINAPGGYGALLASSVSNKGVITAHLKGTVVLASGENYQLQFDSGNGSLSNILVSPSTIAALVENSQLIQAPGGTILMTAQAASTLMGGVVRNTGTIDASGIVEQGGVIRLSASDSIFQSGKLLADAAPGSAANGGEIWAISNLSNPSSLTDVAGTLSAKGGSLGGKGGFIETSASHLVLKPNLQVTTSGSPNAQGTWLLDPTNVTIDAATANNIATALNANTNVSIVSATDPLSCSITCPTTSAGGGDITIASAITATGTGALSLKSAGNIYINANVTTVGSQSYIGPVVLSNNPVLTTQNAYVFFGGAVNSATPAGSSLSVQQGTGNVIFSGAVGTTNSLTTMTTGGTGPVSLGGSTATTGAQSIGGNLVLGASTLSLVSAADGIGITGSISTQPIYRFLNGGNYTLNNGSQITASSVTDALGVSYASGSFTWTPSFTQSTVSVLLVGGGGGGGAGSGGGGGAGGLISTTSNLSSTTAYVFQVGAAGAGGTAGNPGVTGTSTTAFGSVALGGGGGGKTATPGLTGASSGGSGSGSGSAFGGLPSSSVDTSSGTQGTEGGLGYPTGGGGGGGHGTGGGSASSSGTPQAGPGGNGSNWSVTGASVFYAAGGGGGANSAAVGAVGGSSIGGTGGSASTAATAATGFGSGGGGGASGTGSAPATGGSGSAGLVAVAPQYSTNLTINSGTGNFSSGAISNPSSLTILTNSVGTSTVSGIVAGIMALTKQGTGNLNLTGANTYTGGTSIADGKISVSGAGTLGATSSSLTLAGTSILDLQKSLTLGALTMSGGSSITNSTGSSVLAVTGISSLAGSVTTSGTQTYTGAVTFLSDTVLSTTNSQINFGSTLNSNAGSNFSLTTNTGTSSAVFSNVVGGVRALSSLSTNGNASITANINTTGNQTYGGNVVLTSESTTFTSTSGDVSVTGNVTSTFTAPASYNDVYQFLGGGFYSFDSPTNAERILATSTADANGVSWNGSSYTFNKPSGVDTGSILVVGGGGAGGAAWAGGGGGAGGLLYSSSFALVNASYTITVGAGGARSVATVGTRGVNGANSTFGSLTAYGGGGGGSFAPGTAGRDGGSGGGAGYDSNTTGQAAYSSASNLGSSGLPYQNTIGSGRTGLWNHGGGGGGALASSSGGAITTYDTSVTRPTRSVGYSLDGGDGLSYTISGVKTYYAGGGGAGSDGYGGLGGLGGGGNGGHGLNPSNNRYLNGYQVNGIDGLANTGGGGGGGGGNQSTAGGAGGSGIVIASVAATKYGELTVNANSGKLLIQGNVSNVSALNANVNSGTSSQIVGTVSGNLALTKSGTGTLLMSGANTYFRGTTVTNGILQAGLNSAGYSFTQTAQLTSGNTSALFSSINSAVVAGQSVSGLGIPEGTKVANVSDLSTINNPTTSSLTIELSAAPTSSASTTLTFTTPNFMRNSPFGLRAVTVTGGQVDFNGKTVGNNITLSSQNAQGALTNTSLASTATAAGEVELGSNSTVGGSGNLYFSNAFNAKTYGTVFLGTGTVSADNSSNAFSTVSSAAGLGGLSLFNGKAFQIGSVTLTSGINNGLNSTGLLRLYTYDGDITLAQDVRTTSTASASSAPALIISAGTVYPFGYSDGGQVVISGSPTISVGTGGIANIYSGNPNLSFGLDTLINAYTPKATYVPFSTRFAPADSNNAVSIKEPTTAGYNIIYRSNDAITPLYAMLYSGQSITYGTTPTYTFATTKGTATGVLYYGLFTTSAGGATGSGVGNPTVSTSSFINQLSSTLAVGTNPLTYSGGLDIGSASHRLVASNPSVDVTVTRANISFTATVPTGATYTGALISGGYTSTGLSGDSFTVTGLASGTNRGSYTSNLAVSGDSLANYNTPVITNATLVIGPKAVTITNTARTNTYDGTSTYATFASTTAFTTGTMVGTDSVNSVTQTATGVTPGAVAQAGTYSVTPSSAVLGTGTASNYSFTYVTATNTVSKANLTVTGSSPVGSIYSGSAITGSYTTTAVGGDTFTVTGLATGTNAGNYTPNLVVTGAALANYNTPVIVNTALVIAPKPVTITSTPRTNTYDAVTSYATWANATLFTTSSMVGADSVSSVTQTATGVTPSGVAQAGNYSVTPSAAVMGSGTAGNYAFTYVAASNTVNKANISFTATAPTGSVYNGSTFSGGYTSTALGTDSFSVTGLATGTEAGSYASNLVIAGAALANYNTPVINNTTLNIAAKTVTVTLSSTPLVSAYDGVSTYASLASATPYSASALESGDRIVGVTQTATGVNPGAIAQAGSYSVVPSAAVLSTGSGNNNYNFIYVGTTNTVSKANLSVTATVPTTSVYTGSAVNGGFRSTALGGDVLTVTGLASGTNVGSYNSNLVVSGAALSNYNTPVISNATLVITPKPVSISNTASSITYDASSTYAALANKTGFAASGLVGNDSVRSVTQTASGVSPSAIAQVGSYSVVPSAAEMATGNASNYTFTYAAATNSVSKANLSVTATSPSGSVYNGTALSGGYTSTVLGGDTLTVTGLATGTNAGTYTPNLVVSGPALSNYNTPVIVNVPLVIAPKLVTIANTAQSNTYDATSTYATWASGTSFTTSSMVGSDRISSVTQTATGVTPSAVAQAGTNSVVPSSAVFGTGNASNYSLTYVATTKTVNKAPLQIIAQPEVKVFDGTDTSVMVPVVRGLVGSDTVSNLSQSFSNSVVGLNKTINVKSYTVSDRNNGGNYQVNLIPSEAGVITAVPVVLAPPIMAPPLAVAPVAPIATVVAATAPVAAVAPTVVVQSVTAAPAATTGTAGISITTVNTPGQSTTGLITVTVPQSTAVSGVGLTIPLPESVTGPGTITSTSLTVTLSNNEPLPAWISFDPSTKSLVTSAVPSGALPIAVAVTVGGLRTVIEISESQNR